MLLGIFKVFFTFLPGNFLEDLEDTPPVSVSNIYFGDDTC